MEIVASVVTELITQVGFPIAMALVLLWFINKQSERHNIEVTTLRQSLDNNTAVLANNTAILEKILLKGDNNAETGGS